MADNPFGTPQDNNVAPDIFTFDYDTIAAENEITPEGSYTGKLIDLEKSTSKAGNAMWVWYFTIVEGPFAGEDYKMYTAITPAALWKLTETLAAIGQLGSDGKPMAFQKADVINTLVEMDIVPDSYNGVPKASLDGVRPYAGGTGKKHTGALNPTPGL